MGRYAEVQNGIVFNVCDWDGVTPFNPGDGITLILLPDDSPVWIEWTYDATTATFTAPAETTTS